MKYELLMVSYLFLCSCSKQFSPEKELDKKKVTFTITNIESTENAFFIDCERKDEQPIKLISWKKDVSHCTQKLKVGESYTLNFEFEEFMAGDYDGYQYDGKELPLETLIAFSKDLKGLCIKK